MSIPNDINDLVITIESDYLIDHLSLCRNVHQLNEAANKFVGSFIERVCSDEHYQTYLLDRIQKHAKIESGTIKSRLDAPVAVFLLLLYISNYNLFKQAIGLIQTESAWVMSMSVAKIGSKS